jgi:hypothetical protein
VAANRDRAARKDPARKDLRELSKWLEMRRRMGAAPGRE